VKLKIWLGFGESPLFSRKDIPILMVVPRDGNIEQHLTNHTFIDADDLSDARVKMIKAIDDWYEHALHMDKLEKACRDKAAGILPPPPPRARPVILDENSLSIGDEHASIPTPTGSDGLLDLGDLK